MGNSWLSSDGVKLLIALYRHIECHNVECSDAALVALSRGSVFEKYKMYVILLAIFPGSFTKAI